MRCDPHFCTERSRQVTDLRDHAERVVQLAQHLDPADRALLEAVYDRGMSATQLARSARICPRTVRRRVQRLLERLNSPAFLCVLGSAGRWPDRRRRVARAVFLQGCSHRQAARRLGLSLHRIRRETADIQLLIHQQLDQTPADSHHWRGEPCVLS